MMDFNCREADGTRKDVLATGCWTTLPRGLVDSASSNAFQHRWGWFEESASAPAQGLDEMPPKVPSNLAALTEPQGCASLAHCCICKSLVFQSVCQDPPCRDCGTPHMDACALFSLQRSSSGSCDRLAWLSRAPSGMSLALPRAESVFTLTHWARELPALTADPPHGVEGDADTFSTSLSPRGSWTLT